MREQEKLRVLLVDDDPDLVDMLRETLDDTGQFKVFVAHSGTEAYGRIRNLNLDVMVTDYRMPTMSGADLVEATNSFLKDKRLPILFLSGSTHDIPQQVLDRPLIDKLDKPCAPEDLVKKILMLVKRRKLQEFSSVEIDANVLNAFVRATRETMTAFAGLERCESGKLFVLDPERKLNFGVTAFVHMDAQRFHGNLMVSFPEKTLQNITQKILGEPVEELSREVAYTAGEFLNVIWGKTRNLLNSGSYDFRHVFPTVIWGKDKQIATNSDSPMMVIPFLTEWGEFYVVFSIAIEPQKMIM